MRKLNKAPIEVHSQILTSSWIPNDKASTSAVEKAQSVFLAAMAALLLLTACNLRADDHQESNPKVVSIHERFAGLTYGEWIARSYQWLFSIPGPVNPGIPGKEGFISTGQPAQLWFLDELITDPTLDLHYVVPSGKAFYIPLLVSFYDNTILPCPGSPTSFTVPELHGLLKPYIDAVTDLKVEIDGVAVNHVMQYRASTPSFFVTLPDDNLANTPLLGGCSEIGAGTFGPCVAEGYALIVKPLSVGRHVIHESGNTPTPLDVTWHIDVVRTRGEGQRDDGQDEE